MDETNRKALLRMMESKLNESRGKNGPPVRRPLRKIAAHGEAKTPLARILIGVAEARLSGMLAATISTLRLETIVTDNGMEAYMYAQVDMPAAIILSPALPQMDGIETCRKIRDLHDGLEVPILMLMTPAESSCRAPALDAGVTDFLSVPLNTAHLLERIRDLIKYEGLISSSVSGNDSSPMNQA